VIICGCADCPVRVLINRDPEIASQRPDPGTRIKPAVENIEADRSPRKAAFSVLALKTIPDRGVVSLLDPILKESVAMPSCRGTSTFRKRPATRHRATSTKLS
jgi:hypothetical protein